MSCKNPSGIPEPLWFLTPDEIVAGGRAPRTEGDMEGATVERVAYDLPGHPLVIWLRRGETTWEVRIVEGVVLGSNWSTLLSRQEQPE